MHCKANLYPYHSISLVKANGTPPNVGRCKKRGSTESVKPRPRAHRRKAVYVATIEASGLINSLVELDRLQSLGLVVLDEVHALTSDGGHALACTSRHWAT